MIKGFLYEFYKIFQGFIFIVWYGGQSLEVHNFRLKEIARLNALLKGFNPTRDRRL
jgi:hypothetical protein